MSFVLEEMKIGMIGTSKLKKGVSRGEQFLMSEWSNKVPSFIKFFDKHESIRFKDSYQV